MSTNDGVLHEYQALIPTNGKWIWKDGEKPSLEYVSYAGNDRVERRRERRQRGAIHFQDQGASRRAATPSVTGRSYAKGRQSRLAEQRSPTNKPTTKQPTENTTVMLDDVKSVAYDKMTTEFEDIQKDFDSIFSTQQFDEFLLCLLNYFQCFFEKRSHEQKPNPMNIEPSLAEIKNYSDLCSKMETAQKILGQAYGVLLLGIGLDNHHMACGQSRVSNTYRERHMYETLYGFCSYIVWITFRRKEYDVVKNELNRMFRSDTFNPAIRVKNAPDEESVNSDTDAAIETSTRGKKESPAEYRRLHGKRPAIKSIINQRSPALVSILPYPREEVRSKAGTTDTQETCINNDGSLENFIKKLTIDTSGYRMGIIGEAMAQFNPITLMPKGADVEDEVKDEEEKVPASKETTSNLQESAPTSLSQGLSRQQTAISQRTTEALSDDD